MNVTATPQGRGECVIMEPAFYNEPYGKFSMRANCIDTSKAKVSASVGTFTGGGVAIWVPLSVVAFYCPGFLGATGLGGSTGCCCGRRIRGCLGTGLALAISI